MTTRILAGLLATLTLLPLGALAQDAPVLPAPTLDEEPVQPAEPAGEEPAAERQILVRVGGRPAAPLPGDDEEAAPEGEPLPDDVAFVVPGDMRRREGAQGRLQLPGQSPPPPPPFSVAAGAGFTRHLATEAIDYLRLEQRFEARIDEAPEFRFGVGVAELIGPEVLVQAGPRVGFGATFCNEPDLACEAVILFQPGIIAGENRFDFDLTAMLDLRLLVGRIFLPSISGGFSFFGATMVSLAGHVGLAL